MRTELDQNTTNNKKGWNLSVGQRRRFGKTLVLRKWDYLHFLQPVTAEAQHAADELDWRSAAYVLGAMVHSRTLQRAQKITRLLRFGARRRRHKIKLIGKFIYRIIYDNWNEKCAQNWDVTKNYDAVSPKVKQLQPPNTTMEGQIWVKAQLLSTCEQTWGAANNLRRKIPEGKSLTPVFRFGLCTAAERNAAQWYLHNMPRLTTLHIVNKMLWKLMKKQGLTSEECA